MRKIVGVIAATKTDTSFGVDLLAKKGINSIGLSISNNPQEQTLLQTLDKTDLSKRVLTAIDTLKTRGVSSILIYCNSLSGAIDLDLIEKRSRMRIVTPLDVYKSLANKYDCFGLLAANCQSAANIEKIILENNKKAIVIGVGNLKLVNEIEAKTDPNEIIKRYRLKRLCRILKESGCDLVILGCTHFPFFAEELKKIVDILIFEPSEEMAKLIRD